MTIVNLTSPFLVNISNEGRPKISIRVTGFIELTESTNGKTVRSDAKFCSCNGPLHPLANWSDSIELAGGCGSSFFPLSIQTDATTLEVFVANKSVSWATEVNIDHTYTFIFDADTLTVPFFISINYPPGYGGSLRRSVGLVTSSLTVDVDTITPDTSESSSLSTTSLILIIVGSVVGAISISLLGILFWKKTAETSSVYNFGK